MKASKFLEGLLRLFIYMAVSGAVSVRLATNHIFGMPGLLLSLVGALALSFMLLCGLCFLYSFENMAIISPFQMVKIFRNTFRIAQGKEPKDNSGYFSPR